MASISIHTCPSTLITDSVGSCCWLQSIIPRGFMKRFALLILDDSLLRAPALVHLMKDHGWDLTWADGANLTRESIAGAPPDLVLFDPVRLGPQGMPALEALRTWGHPNCRSRSCARPAFRALPPSSAAWPQQWTRRSRP